MAHCVWFLKKHFKICKIVMRDVQFSMEKFYIGLKWKKDACNKLVLHFFFIASVFLNIETKCTEPCVALKS